MSTDAISSITALSNSANTTASTGAAGTATASAPVSLGMGDLNSASFLKLLTVQLQNQDPMNPMDPAGMLTQLAQFTSLQQSQETNSQLTAVQQQNTVTQGASLVGQTLNLQLQNGSKVQGVVQQVGWSNGAMTLEINGTQYPMSNIAAILPKSA